MSWVTILLAMTASACLTLVLVHALIWWWMMRAKTPEAFGIAMRWADVPSWVMIVSLVGFVRFSLQAVRLWLAWTVCGSRSLSLILNFMGFELSQEIFRAARPSDDLLDSEERMSLAAEAANLGLWMWTGRKTKFGWLRRDALC